MGWDTGSTSGTCSSKGVASGEVNMVVPVFSSPAAQGQEGWQEVLPLQQQQQQVVVQQQQQQQQQQEQQQQPQQQQQQGT
jgi:hypothetical protein